MRLLNSSTLQLEVFSDSITPPYAILSHRWQDEEVLFEDMAAGMAMTKAGYKKIENSCRQAAADDLGHVWVDTCCIDKSSSAELSEAINSMYKWYQKAEICYAYLVDVPDEVNARTDAVFAESEWFKRGWTLQELVAPVNLVFFSRGWSKIGHKSTLQQILSRITGIDAGVLAGAKDLRSVSVAKRLSWAAKRETSRPEDLAYCLMGLFGVNMPMIYGEGEKAFIRLQEEIMQDSDDESLFAWTDQEASQNSHHGLLAASPAKFADSGNIVPYCDWEPRSPFSKTNRGLRISLHLSRVRGDVYVAAINCPAPPTYDGFLGIYLKRLADDEGDDQYAHQYERIRTEKLFTLRDRGSVRTLYVRQNVNISGVEEIYPEHVLQLQRGPAPEQGYRLINTMGHRSSTPLLMLSGREWIPPRLRSTYALAKGKTQLAGAVVIERRDESRFAVLFSSTLDFGVAFDVVPEWKAQTFEDFEASFEPRVTGSEVDLGDECVRVDAHSRVRSGKKYYVVDVTITENRRLHMMETVAETVDALLGTVGGQSQRNAIANGGNQPGKAPHQNHSTWLRKMLRIKTKP